MDVDMEDHDIIQVQNAGSTLKKYQFNNQTTV